MDLNINVKLDSDTTEAIALLAESFLSAATELKATVAPATALAPSTPEEHAAEPPKRRKRRTSKPAAEAAPAAAEEPAAAKGEPASAPESAKITREDVRKAAGAFLEAGNDRAKVKGWLEEFGAESITSLDEKHLAEMHSRLTA